MSVTLPMCDKFKDVTANITLYEKEGASKSHIMYGLMSIFNTTLQEILKDTLTLNHIVVIFLLYTYLADLYLKLETLVSYAIVHDTLKIEEKPLYCQQTAIKQLLVTSACRSGATQLYSSPSPLIINIHGDEHDSNIVCRSDVIQLPFFLSAIIVSVHGDGPDSNIVCRSNASQLPPSPSPPMVSIHSDEPDSNIVCSKVIIAEAKEDTVIRAVLTILHTMGTILPGEVIRAVLTILHTMGTILPGEAHHICVGLSFLPATA